MAKLKTTKGYSKNGVPYICFGNRPRKLLIFSGGPGNEIPSGFMLQMMVSNYKCFANHYSVYMLTRKLNQPNGYSTRDMSDDYAKMVRDELGGPVDILGTSYGGLIAQHFAADHPDLVRRLVIGVAAYRVSDEGKELDGLVAKLQSQGRWGKAYAKEMSGVYRRGFKKYLFQYLMLFFGIFKKGTPAYPSDFLIEAEAEGNHDSKQQLAKIKAPTLVIGGDQDFFFPAELYRETAVGISNAKLVLYKGLGHDAIMKRQLIEDILAFLTADIM